MNSLRLPSVSATSKFALCLGTIGACHLASAQHLWYNDAGSGDIMMNDIMISATGPTTYYEVLGWNDGGEAGGYTGIQDTPNGRNYIYSIWDPSNGQAITDVYHDSTGYVEPFGGEGTGMHFLTYGYPWVLGQWYTLVTRAWDYNSHTYFGLWVKDQTAGTWRHLLTFNYPMANIRFNYAANSFLENYGGQSTGTTRHMNLKDGWKRYSGPSWGYFSQGDYDRPSTNANTGVSGNAYFMETGSSTIPSGGATGTLYTTAPGGSPTVATGQLASVTPSYSNTTKNLTVNWTTDATKAPQFGYSIQVFNNSGYTGSPLASATDTAPHIRTANLTTSSLANGIYYIKSTITDIFDQTSNVNGTSFATQTPNAVGIYGGTVSGGSATSMSASDNSRYQVASASNSVNYYAVFSGFGSGSILSGNVTVELNASATGTATISAWNNSTGAWVNVGTTSVGTSDATSTFALPSSPSQYLTSTGDAFIRVSMSRSSSFTLRNDYMRMTVNR